MKDNSQMEAVAISKFILELNRNGISGEGLDKWLSLGRGWIYNLRKYSEIEWIQLSMLSNRTQIAAQAGLSGIGKNGHKITCSILEPL